MTDDRESVPPDAHPRVDTQLSRRLTAAAGPIRGHLAAAVIDLGRDPVVRYAVAREGDTSRLFEIGSVTKGLTGLLLADAIDRGEMDLATTVAEIWPAAAGTELGGVTMLQLCTHTSGLPRLERSASMTLRALRYAYLGMDPYRGLTAEHVLETAAHQVRPGAGTFRYSNLGAAVCGQLIAHVAERDFDALLHERLLAPLAMSDTRCSSHGRTAPAARARFGLRRQPWIMDGYAPAGGVISTITDMVRLACGVLKRTVPGINAMTAVNAAQTVPAGRQQGMFWIIESGGGQERQRVWYNGATGGYSAFLGIRPEARRAIMVLSDRRNRSTAVVKELSSAE